MLYFYNIANIRLFSIAHHLVIAVPTLRYKNLSLLTFNSSWKSDNYEESYQGKKQRTDTKKEAKRVIIL